MQSGDERHQDGLLGELLSGQEILREIPDSPYLVAEFFDARQLAHDLADGAAR